jgi:hypothetical protein
LSASCSNPTFGPIDWKVTWLATILISKPGRLTSSACILAPPQRAAVFCVDEKTAIQALDHWTRFCQWSPGRIERHGFEYKRNGTLSLYAALDVKTGKVAGKTAERVLNL